MAVRLEKYSTDEFLLGKLLFELSDKSIAKNLVYRAICKNRILSILRVIAKYLIQTKDPDKVKLLLARYLIAAGYNYLYDNGFINKSLDCKALRELFIKGFSIEALENNSIKDNTPFGRLLACDITTYRRDIKAIEDILADTIADNSDYKDFIFSLFNFFDYFQIKTAFKYYPENRKSFDIIIAEAINDSKCRKFTIDISDEDMNKNIRQYNIVGNKNEQFSDSFKAKELPQLIRNCKIIFGYLAYEVIVNNKDITTIEAITSSQLMCYSLSESAKIKNKSSNIHYINFLDYYNNYYYVNLSKVNEFEFSFNNEKYIFNNKGIKKL